MGRQRKIRELALQWLYQWDLGGKGTKGEKESAFPSAENTEEIHRLAREKAEAVWRNLRAVDDALRPIAEHWSLSRMAAVDRNILRLAAWEVLFDPNIPKAVAVDEAVEIAKRFSTRESGAFINGILDRLEKPRELLES